uniref:ChrR-like cupin domain-containing protein n=1 Tax=Lotharella oceanica TaxID=641309 RepID=A0A7S2X6J2_9EUKA|mmetsp:Transcript_10883/g.20812  ORF Transcript_10883/g.20812 Transcript_10883/m.20812 type:complete len:158 (+) Transcript_10883:59-532(+)
MGISVIVHSRSHNSRGGKGGPIENKQNAITKIAGWLKVAKPELEFGDISTNLRQQPVVDGISTLVLSEDKKSGDQTVLMKLHAGYETHTKSCHEYWEEVYILEGSLYDKAKKIYIRPGMYACRPPGMIHGPYIASESCTMIVVSRHVLDEAKLRSKL